MCQFTNKIKMPTFNKIEWRSRRAVYTLGLILAVMTGSYCLATRLVFTQTASLHHRLFYIDKSGSPRVKGDTVVFEHNDQMTEGKTLLLTKIMACDEGDDLRVDTNKYYSCNGVPLGKARDKSSKNKPMKNFIWNGVIPPGYFLPLGEHERSYDGRYYGFKTKAQIKMKVRPIF